jgi:hypothetical protein
VASIMLSPILGIIRSTSAIIFVINFNQHFFLSSQRLRFNPSDSSQRQTQRFSEPQKSSAV